MHSGHAIVVHATVRAARNPKGRLAENVQVRDAGSFLSDSSWKPVNCQGERLAWPCPASNLGSG
eukprot:2423817-Rhodomonas_salina.1